MSRVVTAMTIPARTSQLLLILSFTLNALATGRQSHQLVSYAPEFQDRYKPPRTLISNLNNPVGLSLDTPGFRRLPGGGTGKYLFVADGGSQVHDPISPASTLIDLRARVLRVPLYASDLVAGSNRVDGGPDVLSSPEVDIVLTQFPVGQHIDRMQLGHNTISVLGILSVPGSDDLILFSSIGTGEHELARRFSPTPAQQQGSFSVPLNAGAEFSRETFATGNAKTGVFAGSGSRLFFTNVRDNLLAYYEDGSTFEGGERVYFDFGPEGPGLNDPGPGEVAVRYPDAGMGLDVDPITGDLFYAMHGERAEIGTARIVRLNPDDPDPSSPAQVRRTSRISVIGATLPGAGDTPEHEFDGDGFLNGLSFTNIQSIRFGPDPRDPAAEPVLYVLEFAGFQDTSFEDIHTSHLYIVDMDRETNAADKILFAEGILNPVEMLVARETGGIYLSLWGLVETLSGRNLPPGRAGGSVIALEPRTLNGPTTLIASGPGMSSTLVLANPSGTETARGSIQLRDPGGEPLSAIVDGVPGDGFFEFEVPPRGSRFLTVETDVPVSGSAQISSADSISGAFLFSGGPAAATAFPLAEPQSTSLVPVERVRSAGVQSALALLNPTSAHLDLILRLRSAAGLPALEVSVSLPPNGQISRFLSEIFEGLEEAGDFRGILEIDSVVPVNSLVVRTGPNGLALVPPASQVDFSRRLHLPFFGKGLGIESTLILVSGSDTEGALGLVSLWDADGNPLTVEINDFTRSGSFVFSIAPGGSRFFTTSGAGDIATGSAGVSASAPVTAFLVVDGVLGTAVVPSGKNLDAFLLPVEIDLAGGIRTAVALSNPSGFPVELALSLRDSDGFLRSEPVKLVIGPRGQLTRFIDELFPGADLSSFEGTLEGASELPLSALALWVSPGELSVFPLAAPE